MPELGCKMPEEQKRKIGLSNKINKNNSGRFKKGYKPWNYIDGRSHNPKSREMISINKKSVLKSHFIWCNQSENLSYVPEGFVIHHLDRNGFNDNPSNLILIPDKLHRSIHNQIIKIEKEELLWQE